MQASTIYRAALKIREAERREVKRDRCAATTTFLRLCLVPFLGQEVLERSDQKRSKSPTFGIGIREIVFFQQPLEERLRQVLRFVDVSDATPDVRIERRPVRPAQLFKCSIRLGVTTLSGGEH